jgi:trimethylamine---corrinoid protein Co-methyltransferase
MRATLNIIDDALIHHILQESKQILAEIGIEVRGQALQQRLLDAGLPIDTATRRTLFAPELIDNAIRSAPSAFTLYKRDGMPHTTIGDNYIHFVPGSSALNVLDHRNGHIRPATTNDFIEYVRVANGLENIAYLSTAFSTNDDIEPQISDAWRLYLCLTQSKMPIVSGAFTEHGVSRMAAMMQLFRHDRADLIDRPFSIFTITATGMFRYSEDSCQNLLDCVEAGIPIEIVPVTLMGLIAPVTLVEAAIFHTADVLAGITMAQIIKPGAPVLFGGAPATFHMKAATSPMAAIEALQLDAAYLAVGKYLKLPTQAYMALSDSKFIDAQAGAETFGTALLAALARTNSISGPGMLDFVLVFSLAKLVLDNELCGQVLHFMREITPSPNTSALALVRDLLAEQHLITAEHTRTHWPQALYLPNRVIDRENRENWQKAGEPNLNQRLYEEVERRLAAYEPVIIDLHLDIEMRRIMQTGTMEERPFPHIPPHTTKPKPATIERRQRRHRRRQ